MKLKIQEILLDLMGQENGKELKAILLHSIPYDQCRLTDVMESNYTKPYRLEDFARLTCRSLTKFKKDFKETYRIPPKEWIHQKRLEKAKQMIRHSRLDITEVSFLVGYENYSHFIQLFRKYYGITPKQYQKNP